MYRPFSNNIIIRTIFYFIHCIIALFYLQHTHCKWKTRNNSWGSTLLFSGQKTFSIADSCSTFCGKSFNAFKYPAPEDNAVLFLSQLQTKKHIFFYNFVSAIFTWNTNDYISGFFYFLSILNYVSSIRLKFLHQL